MDIYQLLNSSDNETKLLGLSMIEKDPIEEQDIIDWGIKTFYFKDDLINEIILLKSKDPLKFKITVCFKSPYDNDYNIEEIYLNQEQYTYFYNKWTSSIYNKN